MSIVKVGTDIVSIKRVKESIDRFGDRFKRRFLSESEIEGISKVESIAGYWAVKEAISKALGCGIGEELSFLDMEIKKDSKNAPYIKFDDRVKDRFKILSSSVSISHEREFAIAVAILVLKIE